MKIKDIKHTLIFWDSKNQTNCVLGNLRVVQVSEGFEVYDFSKDKYSVYFKHKSYKSLNDAKVDVKRQCDDYFQKALGWIESSVKYKIEEII